MSEHNYHFFIEIGAGCWHHTEASTKCKCGLDINDHRVMKVRGHDDNSWEFAPDEAVGRCFPCKACAASAPHACPRHMCGGCGKHQDACEGHFKEDRPESKLHVDGTLAAAQRAIELQAENDNLRSKLAEHELLFGVALHADDFLTKLLDGLGHQLPSGTPRTVDGIVGAVANMALKLDAHEDASTPAFDEIAALCGCPEWDYPGQVVRDVQHVVRQRDDLTTRRDELLATIARLSNTVPFPDEWKDWEGQRARLVAEVGSLRSQVKFLSDDQVRLIEEREEARAELRTEQLANKASSNAGSAFAYSVESKIRELTAQKDAAYGERDRCVAAIAACAVRLGWDAWLGKHEPDPKWDQDWMNIVFIELPTGQVSWHIHDSELPWFSFLPGPLTRAWDGHTTPEKYERLAGLSRLPTERATANVPVVDIPDGQCPWILDDEDPDEGYWHCKHLANHIGVHETEFGKGRDQRWKMRGYLLPGDTSKAQKPPGGPTIGGEDFVGKSPEERRAMIDAVVMGEPICGCSSKYRELAPGVHAKYCQLAGQPL